MKLYCERSTVHAAMVYAAIGPDCNVNYNIGMVFHAGTKNCEGYLFILYSAVQPTQIKLTAQVHLTSFNDYTHCVTIQNSSTAELASH
jgi:hypothetical protein